MCATGVLWYLVLHHCRVITGNRAKGTSMKFSGFAVAVTTLFSVCTAQSLQTAAPAPFAASPLAGVCMSGQPAGQLTNAGTGTVSVTSDVATVTISVSASRPTAKAAREDAAVSASAVIAAVQQIDGISPTDVESTSVSLTPQIDYGSDGNTQNITGYEFTNGISVKVNNVTGDLLASVTDSAVNAGGNDVRIGSFTFDLSPEVKSQALQQARQQATQDARTTAQAFASQLGVTLGHVILFDEPAPNVSIPTPLNGVMRSAAAASAATDSTPTPVNVGQQTVSTTVKITYSVC